MINKKFLTFIIVTILLSLSLAFISQIKKEPFNVAPVSFPTPTVFPLIERKINISGIKTNDFLGSPKEVNKQGDVLFIKNDKYEFVYLKNFNQFLITILSSPFESLKEQAEIDFLIKLGISKEEACKLNVSISTPHFANPEFSGKKFPLSFCENK